MTFYWIPVLKEPCLVSQRQGRKGRLKGRSANCCRWGQPRSGGGQGDGVRLPQRETAAELAAVSFSRPNTPNLEPSGGLS